MPAKLECLQFYQYKTDDLDEMEGYEVKEYTSSNKIPHGPREKVRQLAFTKS